MRWYRGIAKTNVAIICEIELSIAVTGAISQHTEYYRGHPVSYITLTQHYATG